MNEKLCVVLGLTLGIAAAGAWGQDAVTAPTDNPVATFYDGPEGYPAWTDKIHWDRVIDMSAYEKGKTPFEKFENARDELAAAGGGVLYYPAGTYEFSDGPFDGPRGRGLMLRSGVVIRGQAPATKTIASQTGRLEPGTRFVFGFQKKLGHDVPRDWNLIGLMPEEGKGPESVRNIGVVNVHMTGGIVHFGPPLKWGDTWATAKSWKSAFVKPAWADRRPDGTHPTDAFMGAPFGAEYLMGASGRLVFGCVLEKAALLNDYQTAGRRGVPGGFGPDGFHMAKFAARIGAYGGRVFIANNVLPRIEEGNFLYKQTTVTSTGQGNSISFGSVHTNTVMWDYNRTCGIDVNKDLLGLLNHVLRKSRRGGYFEEGVEIRDNWVFNHGHKGYNVAGKWCTVRNNRNERFFLQGGAPVLGVEAGWRLTLDGFIESSPGGGGPVSDNLSRAFDVAGACMWIGDNVFNNTGSSPGNDGEGICCQGHGGTEITSWAITRNVKDDDTTGGKGRGFIGGFGVHCRGLLVGWNRTAGYAGALAMGKDSRDMAIVGNMAPCILPNNLDLGRGLEARVIYVPEGNPLAPTGTVSEVYQGDAVRVTWMDASGKPSSQRRSTRGPHARETGFRVDRRIGEGKWYTIAFRPPQTTGHPMNPPAWIDFTAPRGKPLVYRVVALTGHPDLGSAGKPTQPVTIP